MITWTKLRYTSVLYVLLKVYYFLSYYRLLSYCIVAPLFYTSKFDLPSSGMIGCPSVENILNHILQKYY